MSEICLVCPACGRCPCAVSGIVDESVCDSYIASVVDRERSTYYDAWIDYLCESGDCFE